MKLMDSGIDEAEKNMQIDEILLENLDPRGEVILHFYDWARESITYGYFIKPERYLNIEKVKERFSIARRPTGGGIVFHSWDLAFSLLMPAHNNHFFSDTFSNYKFVNECLLKAIKLFLRKDEIKFEAMVSDIASDFCMARPTKYDLILNGKKIAGAAQRRKKQGYLHQGSIFLTKPDKMVLNDLILDKDVLNTIFNKAAYLAEDLQSARSQLKDLIICSLRNL